MLFEPRCLNSGHGHSRQCRNEKAARVEAEGAKCREAAQRRAGLGVWKGGGEGKVSGKKRQQREVHEEIRPDTNKSGTATGGLEAAAVICR